MTQEKTSKKRKTKGTPDEVDRYVGQRLRVRRSLLGMSQEKLAKAINLTFQQIQKYERGLNRISAGRLYQFSRILNVPIDYFYAGYAPEGEDKTQDQVLPIDLLQNKETINLLRIYYSITQEPARKNIIKFIKSMAENFLSREG